MCIRDRFLPFDAKNLTKRILELDEFKEYNFNKKELMEAAKKAEEEYQNFKNDICKKGKEAVEYIDKHNLKGIVLAGRPYHSDPEINHGIDTLITSLGLCVLTEDRDVYKRQPIQYSFCSYLPMLRFLALIQKLHRVHRLLILGILLRLLIFFLLYQSLVIHLE